MTGMAGTGSSSATRFRRRTGTRTGSASGRGRCALNGGTIADASGNAANLSLGRHAITNDPEHKVDGTAADTVPPTVTRTWISTPPQGGDTWLAGEVMEIQVTFNEPVEVTGAPRLALTIGDRRVFANYYRLSASRVYFRYTVHAEDRDTDGISIGSGALTLNGGTITDSAGNAANLSLGRHAITNDPDTRWTVRRRTPCLRRSPDLDLQPAAGRRHVAGRRGNADPDHFNEPVEVTGNPRLALAVGDRTAFASYDWYRNRTIQFHYTVQGEDRDADGISIGSGASGALTGNAANLSERTRDDPPRTRPRRRERGEPVAGTGTVRSRTTSVIRCRGRTHGIRWTNGGTITDTSGNAANLSLGRYAITNDPEHKVDGAAADTVPPTVTRTWISSPPQGGDTWLAGEVMEIQVTFNEPVEVTGTPRLALTIGDRRVFANYYRLSESRVHFRYTVQAEDRDADGISIGSGALRLNGGTIVDAAGNAANLSLGRHAVTNDPEHKVDGAAADAVPPSVTGTWISSPPQGGDTWLAGEEMRIQIHFNEPVEVTGNPRLALAVGDRTAFASYDWYRNRTIQFHYTVQGEDRDADGISIGSGALRLNGGTIADSTGNAANLSLGRHAITNDVRHRVDGAAADTVPPRVTRTWISSPPQGGDTWLAGEGMEIQVTFNEPVEVTGTPRLALTVGDRTVFASFYRLSGSRL